MKLCRCPKCSGLVDTDPLEPDISEAAQPFDPESVVGCGANVSEFVLCIDCPNEDNPEACKEIRQNGRFEQMKIKDYKGE